MISHVEAVPVGFKMTELGQLPEDWAVARLSSASILNRSSIEPVEYPDEVFEYYSIPAYQAGGKAILEKGRDILSLKYIVENGTILFGKLNPRVPKVWTVQSTYPNRKITSTEFIPLIPKQDKLDFRFLYYLSWSDYVMKRSQGLVSGSTPSRQRVDIESFMDITIPLPPLCEQRAIANVLSIIQRAIEAQAKVIFAACELKNSLMRYLFTYGPVPVNGIDQIQLKETEIGLMPQNWRAMHLGEVVQGTQYGLSSLGKSSGRFPILRMNNLVNGKIIVNSLQYVDLDVSVFAKFRLNKGDVLFNRTNSYELVGKTSLFDLQGLYVFASYLIRLITESETLFSPFLNYYLNTTNGQINLKSLATRAVSQSNISASKLKTLIVPIPPLPDQRLIADILASIDNKLQIEENHKISLQTLFNTMLHLLMTGQLRVNDLKVDD